MSEEMKKETEYTEKMKANFGFFGLGTFLYSCFYAFCMFRNPSGITFPFFAAGSLLFFCFCLAKLGISLRKGSGFYMVSVMLLAVSTFCTDDGRIISLNKLGILLLMLSLLLNQVYDTSRWKLGKYIGGILLTLFGSLGQLGAPFRDGNSFRKTFGKGKGSRVFYVIAGLVLGIPLFAVIFLLLFSADTVFRHMSESLLKNINFADIFQVIIMVVLMFLAVYCILAYVCEKNIREEVTDRRHGEPILAITVTGMLTVLYLVFCVIQVLYLFLGRMQLPEGYTYAAYAREGFFQLMIVSVLNLVIVLAVLAFFRENVVLKGVLTVMSLCTFVMIASSAMRMVLYIRYYYLTFLRLFVLWFLAVLFLLFVGVILGIFRAAFPLFKYSCVAVTCCYLVLSFSHPDYWIARVNVSNIAADSEEQDCHFFENGHYQDYDYLTGLCADAAPVLLPWIDEYAGRDTRKAAQAIQQQLEKRYINRLQQRLEQSGSPLQYNVSRDIARRELEKMGYDGQ